MSGWTPPNGPGEPSGQPLQRYGRQPRQQPYGQPQPPYGQIPQQFAQPGFQQPAYPQAWHAPPPPKKGNGPLLLIIGGVVVMVLIAAAVVVGFLLKGDGSSSSYTMSTPDTAGGYSKTSDATPASRSPALPGRVTEQFGAGAKAVSAIYLVNGSKVTFVGVSGGSKRNLDISTLIKGIANGSPTHTTDSGGKGSAACAELTAGPLILPMCIWLTDSTMGMLTAFPGLSAEDDMSWSELADVMRKMRPDVEHTA